MIITIDGPAGTGKSTVAKKVAKRLGFAFFDTGAMYRAVAWKVLEKGVDPADEKEVSSLLKDFHFEVQTKEEGEKHYFVNQVDVTKQIREPHISPIASQVATYPVVRSFLVEIQREFGKKCHAVFEGRDMGSVVFPNAEVKIFLTANLEERAVRRYTELLARFPDLEGSLQLSQIQKEIAQRDENDATRALSPLKTVSDASVINTSYKTIEQVVDEIIALVPIEKKYPPMKWSYRFVHRVVGWFFKCCFGLRVHGLHHFAPGAGVIVGNHCSNYDPPVLSISCPEEVHFLAKPSLFKVPLLGSFIRILNAHPVEGKNGDIETFRQVLRLLGEGKKALLFPEGSRSVDGTLQPLERGLSFIVKKGKCPIFPCYIGGTFAAWPIKKRWPKLWGKIDCVFGSPIQWHDFESLDKKEAESQILTKTAHSLKELQRWLENGAHGSPP